MNKRTPRDLPPINGAADALENADLENSAELEHARLRAARRAAAARARQAAAGHLKKTRMAQRAVKIMGDTGQLRLTKRFKAMEEEEV